jgi:hypothetical protein
MRVEGFGDADRNLAALERLADADDLRALGMDALEPVADAARGMVRQRTGRLMRSIGVGTQLSPAQAARVSPDPGTVEIYVGPGSMAQAITEEFGTVREAAHPYMRPAWDMRLGEVIARLRVGAGRRLKRIVKG